MSCELCATGKQLINWSTLVNLDIIKVTQFLITLKFKLHRTNIELITKVCESSHQMLPFNRPHALSQHVPTWRRRHHHLFSVTMDEYGEGTWYAFKICYNIELLDHPPLKRVSLPVTIRSNKSSGWRTSPSVVGSPVVHFRSSTTIHMAMHISKPSSGTIHDKVIYFNALVEYEYWMGMWR